MDAIRAEPSSDEARLVWSDTLSERGDPLGELISVQCKLASLASDATERRKLTSRQNKLLKGIGERWGAWKFNRGRLESSIVHSDRYRDVELLRCTFARGFIDELDADFHALTARIEWIARHAPMLRALRVGVVRGRAPSTELLAVLEQLPELSSLTLCARNFEARTSIVEAICANSATSGFANSHWRRSAPPTRPPRL